MIETNRRKFITGLGLLIAAPVIVRVSSIMPVKAFDPYYTRYLLDYVISTDQMMLRVDRSLKPLPMPKLYNGLREAISEKDVYKFIPKETILAMKPVEGQQLNIHVAFTSAELLNK